MNTLYNEMIKFRDHIQKKKRPYIIVIYAVVILLHTTISLVTYSKTGNVSHLLFNALSLLYFILALSFIMIIFIKINRSYFYKYSQSIVFIASFLFLMFWIPFGLDMTDEGKQMSIAWFIFHGDFPHQYNFLKLGSWVANGLWLSIAGKPLLLWERIGGVILMSIMALVAYNILKRYKNNVYTCIVLFITLLFVICRNHPETKIDHSNFPTLLALLSIYCMLLYTKPDMSFSGNIIFNILSSIIMMISVFTRFPHIIFVIFPLIFFIIALKLYKITPAKMLEALASYYLPIIIPAILGIIVLAIKGDIQPIVTEKMQGIINNFKGLKLFSFELLKDDAALRKSAYYLFLLKRYMKDFIHIGGLGFLLWIALLIGKPLYNKVRLQKFYTKKIDGIFFTLICLGLFGAMLVKPWMWYKLTFGFVFLYLIIISVYRLNLKIEFFYLYWGILLTLISFLGSNNSIRHSVPAGAIFILIPIVFLINQKYRDVLATKNRLLYKFTLTFLVAMLLIGGYKRVFDNNKRDMQMFKLDTMYTTPALFGIFSNEERVEAIDGLLDAAKKHIEPEDTLICYNSVPMIHYLLNHDYYFNDPWIDNMINEYTIEELQRRTKHNQHPDYIVFSKKSGRERDWPVTDVLMEPGDEALYDFMTEHTSKVYTNIYENKGFILFKKK